MATIDPRPQAAFDWSDAHLDYASSSRDPLFPWQVWYPQNASVGPSVLGSQYIIGANQSHLSFGP